MKSNKYNYHEQLNINNNLKLRAMLKELPSFCLMFFRGIEQSTASKQESHTRMILGYFLIILKIIILSTLIWILKTFL